MTVHAGLEFEDKVQALQSRSLKADRLLAPTELASAAMIGRPDYFRSLFFEDDVAMQSPVRALDGTVLVGAHSYMNDGGYMRSRVVIGRFCSIGRRVTLAAGMHTMHGLSTSPALRMPPEPPYDEVQRHDLGIGAGRPGWTELGHDVWIGDGVVVMPGVRIGTGAVIGANAVVTKDIPEYGVAVGAPARCIRMRFPASVRDGLLESKWWQWPREALRQLNPGNVFAFLEQVRSAPPACTSRPTYALLPAATRPPAPAKPGKAT